MRSRAQNTIKEWANDYFVRVNYIDIYGRNVGYDYDFILAKLKEKFPKARTSGRWLRKMAYDLNGSVKLPVRRRSRKILARDFAMSLLIKVMPNGMGVKYTHVVDKTHRKFPDRTVPIEEVLKLERRLRYLNFHVPPRPVRIEHGHR